MFKVSGQTYHPLLSPNKHWQIFTLDATQLCYLTIGFDYFINGDTIFNGIQYKKMFSHYIYPVNPGLYCPPFLVGLPAGLSGYYMREDTIAKKVFMYINGTDQLMYDYASNVGDTISNITTVNCPFSQQIIDSIKPYTLQNGQISKIFYLDGGDFYIEGVGASRGLFGGYCMPNSDAISCVKENNIVVFTGNLWFSNPCLSSVELDEKTNETSFTLSPNPTHDFCTVKSNAGEIINITVYDVTGKILKKQIDKKIDLSIFTNGIYFVEINFKNGKRSYSKIIKE